MAIKLYDAVPSSNSDRVKYVLMRKVLPTSVLLWIWPKKIKSVPSF